MSDLVTEYAHKLADTEFRGWQLHHRKQYDELEKLSLEMFMEFGCSEKTSKELFKYFKMAALSHDEAEKLEDSGKLEEANVQWEKTRGYLRKYYEIRVKEYTNPMTYLRFFRNMIKRSNQ